MSKKALLLAAAIVAAAPAWAEWTQYAEVEGTTFYADASTKRGSGAMKRIWTMESYSKPANKPRNDLSAKRFFEFDCSDGRYLILQTTFYKRKLGAGDVSASISDPTEWKYWNPQSVAEGLAEIGCGQ